MQENVLSINVLLDGTSVYDTSYSLTSSDAETVYKQLGEMGVTIYSEETPEWRNKQSTVWNKKNSTNMSQLMSLLDGFDQNYAELYLTLKKAALDLSKPIASPLSQISDGENKIDTFNAD
jgi:hypothetical protein